MQIILMEKVVNLGGLGDLVNVKPGYARNFLIPNGKAKRATPLALKEFEVKRAELEQAAAVKLAEAQAFAEKLGGVIVKIARKAGVDGRLFGSVTNFDVADALKAQGFDIEKSSVRMPLGPIKTVSENSLEIALHTDVLATVTVSVVGEL
jgi:large subunit ribosomal protein L9